MYDVFILCSSTDTAWTEELARRVGAESFQARHLKAWFDDQQLMIGDHLRPELETVVKGSRYIGLVLTDDAISRWGNFDWLKLYDPDRDTPPIIQLLLEKCEIPTQFKDRVQIDFTDDSDFESGFSQLIGKISPGNKRAERVCRLRQIENLLHE